MLTFSHLKFHVGNVSFICKFLKPSLKCSDVLLGCLTPPAGSPHSPSTPSTDKLILHAWTHGVCAPHQAHLKA
jgi:hypothetical protein